MQIIEENDEIRLINRRRDTFLGDYVIMTNEYQGTWVKIPKDCYEYIVKADKERISKSKFISSFSNSSDKEYIGDLLDIMSGIGLFENGGNDEGRRLQKITVCVTNSCNLHCIHCSVNATSKPNRDFSPEELIEVLNKVIAVNPEMIVISGGEPLVRKDFIDFSVYLRKHYQGKIMLMTNGTQIYEKEAEIITECYDEVSVSLDGYNEETCDFIRGKGTYNRTIDAIRFLKASGCTRISTSMILCGQNENTIRLFKKINSKMGTKEIFRALAPVGRASENYNLLIKSKEGEFLRESVERNRRSEIDFSQRVIGSTTVCDAIIKQICVGADGLIYPCAGAQLEEFALNNIREVRNLSSYLVDEEFKFQEGYKKFISITPSRCEPCKQCTYNVCCFGCPVYLYLYKKNEMFEAFCEKQKNRLNGSRRSVVE